MALFLLSLIVLAGLMMIFGALIYAKGRSDGWRSGHAAGYGKATVSGDVIIRHLKWKMERLATGSTPSKTDVSRKVRELAEEHDCTDYLRGPAARRAARQDGDA